MSQHNLFVVSEPQLEFEANHAPRSHEGFLFSPEAEELRKMCDFDSAIVDIHEHVNKIEIDDNGNATRRYAVRFDDGVLLSTTWTQTAQEVADEVILMTPALFTGSHGQNEVTAHKFAEAGFSSLLIGHHGEERRSWIDEAAYTAQHPYRVLRNMRNISLARQAHHMHLIHNAFSETTNHNTVSALSYGESRGAMTQNGLLALPELFPDRYPVRFSKVVNVDAGDKKVLTCDTLPDSFKDLAEEIVGLAGLIGYMSIGRARRSLNTINISPKSVAHELAHLRTLTNGDSGKLQQAVPLHQEMLNISANGGIVGEAKRWQEAYKNHPNVRFIVVRKAHVGSIADERTVAAAIKYFKDKPLLEAA